MPLAIAPVIKSGRGVHCVSGHPPRLPSVEEEKGQGLHRSRTLSEMDHTKRCAIVLERDQSLSSNPQLAHWSNETRDEVKRALSSHIPHEHSERRSRYHTKDELLNTRGSIRRDTLRRKPVPPIPAELKEAYTQANNHHHRPSNPSPPSTRRHQSVTRTSAATSSTLTSSPKSIESDLRTLVDDDDEWDFLSSDMDSCMGPVVQDLDDVPPITVFINIRTKAAVSICFACLTINLTIMPFIRKRKRLAGLLWLVARKTLLAPERAAIAYCPISTPSLHIWSNTILQTTSSITVKMCK